MRRITVAGLSLVLLAALMTGCHAEDAPALEVGGVGELTGTAGPQERKEYLNGYGAALHLEQPERVVALTDSLAEVWLAAGGTLLFREQTEEKGEEGLAVSAEEVLELKPDFVILSSQSAEHGAMKSGFSEAGVEAAYFSVTHFEDYLNMLDFCTQLTGRPDLFEERGTAQQIQIEEILAAQVRKDPPRVALVSVGKDGAQWKDSRSTVGRIIQELGGVNIADDKKAVAARFSAADLLRENPDCIFILEEEGLKTEALEKLIEGAEEDPVLRCFGAVKSDRLYFLPFSRFPAGLNTRWAECYAELAEMLY